MCKEFGQTCADGQENIRILLQIFYERNNHLANIIHASNGLIIAILVGVLAFAGSIKEVERKPFFITLIVAIIVISLITWRLYAHYVDNDILGIYGKILCCENKLNVPIRTSLLLSLVRGLSEKSCKRKELMDLVKSEQFSRAYNEMFLSIEEMKIGDRGHLIIDIISLFFCILSIILGGFVIFSNLSINENTVIGFVLGFLAAGIIIIISVYRYLPIAKNPE